MYTTHAINVTNRKYSYIHIYIHNIILIVYSDKSCVSYVYIYMYNLLCVQHVYIYNAMHMYIYTCIQLRKRVLSRFSASETKDGAPMSTLL